ncbi:hypothetical protein OOK36_48815 [Streptomyces sp. NBC_00365]|nr:hypothetical protein [Streptomyces sp. NBC_00365]
MAGWEVLPAAEDDPAWTLARRRVARRRTWLVAAAAVTGFAVAAAGAYLIVEQKQDGQRGSTRAGAATTASATASPGERSGAVTASPAAVRALQNLRMDFLVLLPGNRRAVLEVDGMQHYTRNAGAEPDSAKYATAMAGDRDLKFCGYEVFRFGHDELRDRDGVRPVVTEFLRTLLDLSPGRSFSVG